MPVIAFDLGGTKLSAALFSDAAEILHTQTVSLERSSGREVGQLITEQALLLSAMAGKMELKVNTLGICIPGIAYTQTGNVWAPNIPGWENYPLREELEAALHSHKIRVKIDSDRACSILGEVWKGNARGCSDAIFLAVGTGIGAGILCNNKLLRGSRDIAGATGWMGLDRPYAEKYAGCGCFEYQASGEGIARVAREWLDKQPSVLQSAGRETITAKTVFAAAEEGDILAQKIIQNAVECWGMAVANLVSLFNPEKIIFGGGIFGPGLKYLDAISAEAKKWAQPIAMQQVILQGSALGTQAGLYGAGKLALDGSK